MKFKNFRAGLKIIYEDHGRHEDILLDDPIIKSDRFYLHLIDRDYAIVLEPNNCNLRFLKIIIEQLIVNGELYLGELIERFSDRFSSSAIKRYAYFMIRKEVFDDI